MQSAESSCTDAVGSTSAEDYEHKLEGTLRMQVVAEITIGNTQWKHRTVTHTYAMRQSTQTKVDNPYEFKRRTTSASLILSGKYNTYKIKKN